MKFVAPALALIGLLVAVPAPEAKASEPAKVITIGMVQGMFRDIQPALIQAMSRPLRDIMTKQTGLDGEVEVCADAFELAEKMAKKELQMGVFHGFEFAWIADKHPEIVPIMVTVPAGRKVSACVVVHKDCEADGLAGLGTDEVLIPRGAKAHTLLYLESQRAELAENVAKPKSSRSMTTEDVLDSIVIGDCCAALVDAAALSGYKTIQPGAFRQLKVLCESEAFPPAVIAYRRDAVSPEVVEQVKTGLAKANQTISGRPLLAMWNLRGFEEVPKDYPAQLEAVRKIYPSPKTGENLQQ